MTLLTYHGFYSNINESKGFQRGFKIMIASFVDSFKYTVFVHKHFR